MRVATLSNSLILGGWVTKVLNNGDKNRGVEGWVIKIFRPFRPTVLDKKCHFSVYFYTHLPIYLIKETACWAIFSFRICKVS